MLGRDIATILSVGLKERVLEIINKETGVHEGSKLVEDMLLSNVLIEVDYDYLLGLLEEAKKGILERI